MKHLLPITLALITGLLSPLSAAETPTKKKAASSKAETASEEAPSAKAEAIARTLTASEKTKLLSVLNEGDDKALMALPGIGATRATALKKARPFEDPAQLVLVEGIGEATLAEMVAHAKAGFPAEAAAPAKPTVPASKAAKKAKKKNAEAAATKDSE